MKAYNLADLEAQLDRAGWSVLAEPYTLDLGVPGLVHEGGYTVTLTSPQGAGFAAQAKTRADALRGSAELARVLDDSGPPLMKISACQP